MSNLDTNGAIHLKERSWYNHNYYQLQNGDIILEKCDDDTVFSYYLVDEKIEYLGDYYYESIFGLQQGLYELEVTG